MFLFFCTPFFASNIRVIEDSETTIKNDSITVALPSDLSPDISQYLIIGITASNTGSVDYPTGTVAIQWGNEEKELPNTEQQRFKIYIDGMSHNYYVPVGENKYWTGTRSIQNLVFEIPRIEGVNINVGQISLKKRIAYPADIYISRKIQDLSDGMPRTTDPSLIPTYILLVLFLTLSAFFYFLFRSYFIKKGRKISQVIKKAVFIFIISIMLLFSISFIYKEIITVRSYWDSYKKHIIAGSLDQTYFGFYDFEKFIMWVDGEVPEGIDIIVYVRGEPVYIMSEMAYNLYPRDIKFINISGKNYDEINAETENINKAVENTYDYLIVLSEEDASSAFRFELLARYRTTGGFIYRIK